MERSSSKPENNTELEGTDDGTGHGFAAEDNEEERKNFFKIIASFKYYRLAKRRDKTPFCSTRR